MLFTERSGRLKEVLAKTDLKHFGILRCVTKHCSKLETRAIQIKILRSFPHETKITLQLDKTVLPKKQCVVDFVHSGNSNQIAGGIKFEHQLIDIILFALRSAHRAVGCRAPQDYLANKKTPFPLEPP